MATIEVKKIHVVQTALAIAVVSAVLGFIEGILVALGAGTLMTAFSGVPMAGVMFTGVISVILFPITAFIVTFIVTAITAIIYNFVAERIGGIRFEY